MGSLWAAQRQRNVPTSPKRCAKRLSLPHQWDRGIGAWSDEPFGNDTASNWAWELDGQDEWQVVQDALNEAVQSPDFVDADIASNAIAAAETVAHGLGRPTQNDAHTESVVSFSARASKPSEAILQLAVAGLTAATGPASELTELWAEGGEAEWMQANSRIMEALVRPDTQA